jgi:hypothetical protein
MRNYISPVILEKVPYFLKSNFKGFLRFIQHFYEFLEEQGNPLEVLETFYENNEVNNEIDEFIDNALYELGFDIEKDLSISKKELILHLREFYLSRGSADSFKFLFRILYNTDVSISYPRSRLLIPSQATYSGRYFIFTTTNTKNTSNFLKILSLSNEYDIKIFGISSKSEAYVEAITQIYSKNKTYLKIQIDSPFKTFQKGEGLEIVSNETGIKITENVVDTAGITIDNPGKLYKIGDKIQLTDTDIVGLARVKTLKEGAISDVEITDGGDGYALGEQILTNKRNKGHSFSAVISEIDNSNVFLSVPNDSSVQLESGDFTIESWVYRKRSVVEETLCSTVDENRTKGWIFKIEGSNKLSFSIYKTNQLVYKSISTIKINSNRWTHVAVTRTGNTVRLFINGTRVSEDIVDNGTVSTNDLKIGNDNNNNIFIGYMKEFRIVKGVSYYETSFLPSVAKLPDADADVSLLLHFDDFDDSSLSNKIVSVSGNIVISSDEIIISNSSGYFSGLGKISKINILNHGYNYDSLPLMVILTEQGSGAILTPTSDSIGQIESIEIVDPFINLSQTSQASVISQSGQGAVLSVISNSIFNERPSWKSYEGMLGINSNLLDSYYFQQFSYEVYSSISRKEYDKIVDSWIHPAGFVRFSVLDISFSEILNPPNGGFGNSFLLTIIKLINGKDFSYMINPMFNLEWFKELSEVNFTNGVGGFDWIQQEWVYSATHYMSQALDVSPILKIVNIRYPSYLVNPQSRLDWFKESQFNYFYDNEYWREMTVGDEENSNYNRKQVNDDSNIMSEALDSEIAIINI